MPFPLRSQGDDQNEARGIPEALSKKMTTKEAITPEGKASNAEENEQHNQGRHFSNLCFN